MRPRGAVARSPAVAQWAGARAERKTRVLNRVNWRNLHVAPVPLRSGMTARDEPTSPTSIRKRLRTQRICEEIFVSRRRTNGFESHGIALQCRAFSLPR